MSYAQRLKWMATIKGGGTVSPMYMEALAQAVDQGQLTLCNSVHPWVFLPPAATVTVSQDGSGDAEVVYAQAKVEGQESSQQDEVAVPKEGKQQHVTPKFGLRPMRVVFEPIVPSGKGITGAPDDDDDDGNGEEEHVDRSVAHCDDTAMTPHVNEKKDGKAMGAAAARGFAERPTAEFDKIRLGTGVKPDCRALPSIRDLLDNCEAVPIVGGFPVLTTELQWGSLPVFVVGALAGLQLGPGALNLMGARHGADIVAAKLGVNDGATTGGNICHNIFAALARESDSEEEDSTSESEDEDEQFLCARDCCKTVAIKQASKQDCCEQDCCKNELQPVLSL
jgi:hypothetical protein